ncbi:hypothetical protein L0Y40_00785 [Candidatus Wolfebacteria bacterium]|nr:hypothetical protein [Candidatus Wolfebacteria bacterium]
MQKWIGDPSGLQKALLDGLWPSEVVRAPEPVLDFTVRVNRFVVLPNWADPNWLTQDFMSLQTMAPAEYDLRSGVEQWLHDDQKTGMVKGQRIYDHLKATSALANQLGLTDLLAIQKMGIVVFRKLFGGNAVFGWRSVVRSRVNHGLDVPFLCASCVEVVLGWVWLDRDFRASDPGLRFRLPAQAGK